MNRMDDEQSLIDAFNRCYVVQQEYIEQYEMRNQEIWYLLFGGRSDDGCGLGKYICRTTDKKVARKHYELCQDDPYSTGYVIIITKDDYQQAGPLTNWDN